jgi:hypothetical protein
MRMLSAFLISVFLSFGGADADEISTSGFWKAFRKSSPFPLQDVIASPIGPSGEAIIILTEPSPQIWSDREHVIKAAFGDKVASIEVFTQPIGFDGSVKDIVLRLQDVNELALSEGVQALSIASYGTAYGASYRTFAAHAWDRWAEPRRLLGPPNLQISAASLNKWFFEAPLGFIQRTAKKDGSFEEANVEPVPLEKLLGRTDPGVFYSEPPGLVLLIFDRNRALNDAEALFRQFSLDSDALLGAVTKRNSKLLALVGRERTTPFTDMPPLRVDTILTLAAAHEDNLAQSYERKVPLAGPILDAELRDFLDPTAASGETRLPIGPKFPQSTAADWAPILLSRELVNTEYGQLLNMTDQMLKGWSRANLIAYGNFPYPAPAAFPHVNGIRAHLRAELGSSFNQLTYNWNTAGFGSLTDFGEYQIFSMLNSNALPISFIPDLSQQEMDPTKQSVIRAAEDQYGQYFAGLRDPNLNRVAQYAALHVIFTRFPVKAERSEPLVAQDLYDHRWVGLKSTVSAAVLELSRLTGDNVSDAVAKSGGHIDYRICGGTPMQKFLMLLSSGQEVKQLLGEYGRDSAKRAELVDAMVDRNGVTAELGREYASFEVAREPLIKAISDFYNTKVPLCNSNPFLPECSGMIEESAQLDREKERLLDWQAKLEKREAALMSLLEDAKDLTPWLAIGGDCRGAWQSVRDAQADALDGISKTPSIVASTDVEGLTTGGHSLDGRSIEVIADSRVTAGMFRIDEQGNVLRINPKDIPKSTAAAREFERARVEFLNGSDAAKKRIRERVAASLRSDTAPAELFGPGALARKEAPPRTRAFGGNANRNIVGGHSFDVPEPQLAIAIKLAGETQADLVAASQKGVYSLIDPGPPPLSFELASPFDMMRKVEALAAKAAKAHGGKRSFVVVSDGSISAAEMDGLRISSRARQLVDAAGRGSGYGPPRRGRLYLSPDEGPRPKGPVPPEEGSAGGSGKPWRMLDVFPYRDAMGRLLQRTDADWARASLDRASVNITTDGKMIGSRLSIPFKTERGLLRVKLNAFFKRRPAGPADANKFIEIIERELDNVPDGTMICTKIADIRAAFVTETNGDASLQGHLIDNYLDFFVTEFVLNEPRPVGG